MVGFYFVSLLSVILQQTDILLFFFSSLFQTNQYKHKPHVLCYQQVNIHVFVIVLFCNLFVFCISKNKIYILILITSLYCFISFT